MSAFAVYTERAGTRISRVEYETEWCVMHFATHLIAHPNNT